MAIAQVAVVERAPVIQERVPAAVQAKLQVLVDEDVRRIAEESPTQAGEVGDHTWVVALLSRSGKLRLARDRSDQAIDPAAPAVLQNLFKPIALLFPVAMPAEDLIVLAEIIGIEPEYDDLGTEAIGQLTQRGGVMLGTVAERACIQEGDLALSSALALRRRHSAGVWSSSTR